MTTLNVTPLRPGLLVSLKTTVKGGVHTGRTVLEDRVDEAGQHRTKAETDRIIERPDEHARAIKVRTKCCTVIRAACVRSPDFGLLCPEAREDELNAAIEEARRGAREFNLTASITRVSVNVVVGRIIADDERAVRSISSEISSLMGRMQEGFQRLDVEAIRAAANQAKAMGDMLTDDARKGVQDAVKLARETARRMVKAGEQAAAEVDAVTLAKLAEVRTAFLDLDTDDVPVAAPEAEARGLDLDIEAAAEANGVTPEEIRSAISEGSLIPLDID